MGPFLSTASLFFSLKTRSSVLPLLSFSLYLEVFASFLTFRNSMFGRLINLSSAAKLLIFSVTVLSSSFLFKLALVSDSNFNLFLSSLPRPWISLRLWLSPIHVYFLLNFIILTIVATSAFQSYHKDAPTATASTISDKSKITDSEKEIHEEQSETKQTANNGSAESGDKAGENEMYDTMDATWKAIMEAQGKPRSEIWNLPAAKRSVDREEWKKLKEKSASEEELKRKAEAFIKKIYEEMRLEREESELRLTKKKVLQQGKLIN